ALRRVRRVRRFLVVDDSPTVRLSLKAAIRKSAGEHAAIDEAEDAESAISSFARDPPDVVFLDMMLAKGTTGGMALERILATAPEARVVLVTGLPEGHADVVDAISRGAAGFLRKPVRVEAVREILDT